MTRTRSKSGVMSQELSSNKKQQLSNALLEYLEQEKSVDINEQFLQECYDEFNAEPINRVTKNAIVSMGSLLTTINADRLKDINHIFLNTLKKKNVKATNQGHSGRCWLFSGLNMFRHNIIRALDLENFEFSETYLYFWDKLERSNSYLRWFLDHPESNPGDRDFDFMLETYMSDGGWWNCFSNLVNKYGLVPKSAMGETFQSGDSEDMNRIIDDHLSSCANYIVKNRQKLSEDELRASKDKTLKSIYNTLVKFLGEPPTEFSWAYTNEEENSNVISKLSPVDFTHITMPSINMSDFIVLTNTPTKNMKFNRLYEIRHTNNIYEGEPFRFLNLPMNELTKYAVKSIQRGMPVWFAADVRQKFNPYHSTLDDKLVDDSDVFEVQNKKFNKGERITFRNVEANHAMTIVGVNVDDNGIPVNWQVENSWGYWDNQIPGEDGFLSMSHSWFKEYVIEIVVHKNYLSRTIKKLLDQDPIIREPWDSMAPALRVKPMDAPRIYHKISMMKGKPLK